MRSTGSSSKATAMKCLLISFLAVLATASLDITDQLDFELGVRPRQTPTNLQVFTGALGGIKASAISQSGDPGRPFEVDGDTFVSLGLFLFVLRGRWRWRAGGGRGGGNVERDTIHGSVDQR